jgi:hypothetical protein
LALPIGGALPAGVDSDSESASVCLNGRLQEEHAMPARDAPDSRLYKTEWEGPKIFRPEARSYANMEELVAHIAEITGAEPSSPTSIRYRMVRRGSYVRQQEDGSHAISFGDPVLDSITSPVGEIVVGGRSLGTVTPGRRSARLLRANVCQPGPDNLQTCWSEDGSLMVISDEDGSSVRFHVWNDSNLLGWSMGASIATTGPNFERAQINSRYYLNAVAQLCAPIYDSDHGANDDYMSESEEGAPLFSERPHRIESLCRVQWNGHRLRGVVRTGDDCHAEFVEPWPEGYPDDWPPLAGGPGEPPPAVTVSPQNLTFSPSVTNPHSSHYVLVSNPFDTTVAIDVSEAVLDPQPGPGTPLPNPFSNVSGHFTIPPMGVFSIQVLFNGTVFPIGAVTPLGHHYSGSFEVDTGPVTRTVRLEGQLREGLIKE